MKHHMLLVVGLLLGITLLVNGCVLSPLAIDAILETAPTPQVEEATPVATRELTSIEQTTWVLHSLNGELSLPEEEVTLEFFSDSHPLGDVLRGDAICNYYGSLYDLNGHSLTISEFQTSLVGCSSAIEQQYFDSFPRVSSYEIDKSTLTLTTDLGETLVFMPQETVWILQSLNGEPALSEQRVTLKFSGSGQVLRGSAGCNDYGVPYQVSEHRLILDVDRFGRTLFDCYIQNIMEQEQQYLDILLEVTSYEIDGSTLTLTTDVGETLIFTNAS